MLQIYEHETKLKQLKPHYHFQKAINEKIEHRNKKKRASKKAIIDQQSYLDK